MTRSSRMVGAARMAMVTLALLLAASPAFAQLRLDVTRGKVEPMPIAIPPFAGGGADESKAGRDIAQVVSADLERSGLFRPLDPQSFIQNVSAGEGPRFADWRQINAQALVTGSMQGQGDGRYRVEFRLWDVGAEQQLAGFAYTTTRQNWRRIAHIIADEIYKRITGEDGYFDTRIVYIAESGPAERREKRLALMDQDGANHQYLTDGRALVLTPRFSPSAQEITYLSYAGGTPRVYLRNIDSGQQEALGDFPGMTFAPRFSPSAQEITYLSYAGGTPRVYLRNIDSGQQEALGDFPGMTFAPRFSPEGNRIVFSRTQNGASNIYALDLRTRQPLRLTDGNAIDTTPSYSPD
ncbi:MAG: Tol-Pal system protein TolB, partial [Alphaproteobacteria bacterium]